METHSDLQRFKTAQEPVYNTALAEIKSGKKNTHWIWFIFPQILGLGISETSKFYSIKNRSEAEAYLNDSILGPRLVECCEAIMELQCNDASKILGRPDDVKLKSCMTLFAALNRSPVFNGVLLKFFKGESDNATLQILSTTGNK